MLIGDIPFLCLLNKRKERRERDEEIRRYQRASTAHYWLSDCLLSGRAVALYIIDPGHQKSALGSGHIRYVILSLSLIPNSGYKEVSVFVATR